MPSQMVASSSAGFFNSITPRGRPLTNSTTSGLRAAPVLGDGELVDRQPVVPDEIVEVDHPDQVTAHHSPGIAVLDLDAVHDHPVELAVAGFQRSSLGMRQLADCVVKRIGGQTRIGGRLGRPRRRRSNTTWP